MSSVLYCINTFLSRVVADVPLGTHLGLFHLLWTLRSGRLLQSRGAVIPARAACGRGAAAVRRAWAARAAGRWGSAQLLAAWPRVGQDDGQWPAHRHGGSRPVACALGGGWRPRRPACPTPPAWAQAGKALPALARGLAARIGAVGSQRRARPCLLRRTAADDAGEPALPRRLGHQPQARLAPEAVRVTARGFPLAQRQAAGRTRSVRRGPTPCTARRATLPGDSGKGRRPSHGPLGRPRPRTAQRQTLAATPPDRCEPWQGGTPEAPGIVCAQFWAPVGRPDAPRGAPTFPRGGIHAPHWAEPVLLHTPLPLSGAQGQAMSRERGPVEGLPLWATQRLGAARQFVCAPESRPRRPAGARLAGSLLAYTAATPPALSTGFWDRAPRPTSSRRRRVLAQGQCQDVQERPLQLRKKQSPTAHFPPGICGHRRQQKATPLRYDRPLAA